MVFFWGGGYLFSFNWEITVLRDMSNVFFIWFVWAIWKLFLINWVFFVQLPERLYSVSSLSDLHWLSSVFGTTIGPSLKAGTITQKENIKFLMERELPLLCVTPLCFHWLEQQQQNCVWAGQPAASKSIVCHTQSSPDEIPSLPHCSSCDNVVLLCVMREVPINSNNYTEIETLTLNCERN